MLERPRALAEPSVIRHGHEQLRPAEREPPRQIPQCVLEANQWPDPHGLRLHFQNRKIPPRVEIIRHEFPDDPRQQREFLPQRHIFAERHEVHLVVQLRTRAARCQQRDRIEIPIGAPMHRAQQEVARVLLRQSTHQIPSHLAPQKRIGRGRLRPQDQIRLHRDRRLRLPFVNRQHLASLLRIVAHLLRHISLHRRKGHPVGHRRRRKQNPNPVAPHQCHHRHRHSEVVVRLPRPAPDFQRHPLHGRHQHQRREGHRERNSPHARDIRDLDERNVRMQRDPEPIPPERRENHASHPLHRRPTRRTQRAHAEIVQRPQPSRPVAPRPKHPRESRPPRRVK